MNGREIIDEVVIHVPVVAQRQFPMNEIVQRTVEAPKVQYIDKVAGCPGPVDMQRQAHTVQGAQHHVDISASTQRQVPTIQDAAGPCHSAIGEDDSDDLHEPAGGKEHSGS